MLANDRNDTVSSFTITPARPAPDVTVVIAAYAAKERIQTALASLADQTLAPSKFEVVVVLNGLRDGTGELLRRLRAISFPAALRIITTETAGASNARNLGIAASRGKFLTFVDDDDRVSPHYLEELLRFADDDLVAMAPIADVYSHDEPCADFNNYLNNSSFRFAGETVPFQLLTDSAAANAGKIVSTRVAQRHGYSIDLKSGEDVVFWTTVMAAEDLRVRVLPPGSGAVYYRLVRDASVSRSITPQFALDRIHAICALVKLAADHPTHAQAISRLLAGQVQHLARYLEDHPSERPTLLDKIGELGVDGFPYAELNTRTADRLVVSYAFPPYMDTSAMVVARRICVERRPVDVLMHTMDNIRNKDALSMELIRESVGTVLKVGGPAVFSNWRRIAIFANLGNEMIESQVAKRRRPYREIYSRTMWPAAHVAAALYKVRNPSVRWVAEFSDPMRIASDGSERVTEIPEDDPVFGEIEKAVAHYGLPTTDSRNLWEWVENIAYALADEVVFTNSNQMKFMLKEATKPALAARASSLARVDRHPTLPQRFYELEKSDYELPDNRINIGYFGVFYAVRGVGDLIHALEALEPGQRDRVMLHIFTNTFEETAEEIAAHGLTDCVRVQPYIPYLEFLELSRRFDWLVVTDARVADVHGINPYLPSKYSDYVGSGARIWSIVEPGSVLSTIPVDAMSELGDASAATSILMGLSEDVLTAS